MPRRRNIAGDPKTFVVKGAWPNGRFARDAPPAAAYAQDISRSLAQALEGRSKADVAAAADLHRSTLYGILAGDVWPDVVTLAKLETVLQCRLWPDRVPEND